MNLSSNNKQLRILIKKIQKKGFRIKLDEGEQIIDINTHFRETRLGFFYILLWVGFMFSGISIKYSNEIKNIYQDSFFIYGIFLILLSLCSRTSFISSFFLEYSILTTKRILIREKKANFSSLYYKDMYPFDYQYGLKNVSLNRGYGPGIKIPQHKLGWYDELFKRLYLQNSNFLDSEELTVSINTEFKYNIEVINVENRLAKMLKIGKIISLTFPIILIVGWNYILELEYDYLYPILISILLLVLVIGIWDSAIKFIRITHINDLSRISVNNDGITCSTINGEKTIKWEMNMNFKEIMLNSKSRELSEKIENNTRGDTLEIRDCNNFKYEKRTVIGPILGFDDFVKAIKYYYLKWCENTFSNDTMNTIYTKDLSENSIKNELISILQSNFEKNNKN